MTTDIFSTLQCPFLRSDTLFLQTRSPNSYSISVTTIEGDTVCTVLGKDLAFHVWRQVVHPPTAQRLLLYDLHDVANRRSLA